MKTLGCKNISRLPASRFPVPADHYFCDNCGRDLTKNLYRDRAPVWQPLRPMWYVCPCGQKYLSGAAEWDDLTAWEREQRIAQLLIGFVLLALLVTPVILAYFALTHGGAALLAVVGIALIPSVLVAKPFGFVLIDVYEIMVSIWRTRAVARRASPAITLKHWMLRSRPHNLRFVPIAVVIAVLIIATRWIPPRLVAASPMSAVSSPERSNTTQPETMFTPTKLSPSRPARAAVPGAPSPAFKRVRVGPNEVDYIAEDVTIRHFTPVPARSRLQATNKYKEVQIGDDVTMRYFSSDSAVAPQARHQ